jgi:hypothetical protein
MTWACFLQCYWGQDAPLYIGCNSQKENRDLPEQLWANCPLPLNAFLRPTAHSAGKGPINGCDKMDLIWRPISISNRH